MIYESKFLTVHIQQIHLARDTDVSVMLSIISIYMHK